MNISSDIFPTGGSNTPNQLFVVNGTRAAMSAIQIMTIVLSIPTNSYVIWLIVKRTGNGLAAEFFSLNLSICEILLCVKNVLDVIPDETLNKIAFSGKGLPMTGRSLFQCLMCVDRYLAVVRPVTFLKYKSLRYRVICSFIVWIAIVASCGIVALFNYFQLIPLLLCFTVVQLIIFLFIQLFCCLSVLRALQLSGPGEKGREKDDENHMKKRAFNVILINTVSMLIIYAPTIISNILFLARSVQDSEISLTVAECSFTFGGLVQPFLFLHRVGKQPFIMCQ